MPVMGFTKFERFFRAAGGVSVDRDDVKRYLDFVNDAIYDLLIIGQATAKANVRDVIEPWDLPITKGLQESTHAFQRLEEEIELGPILESLTARPPLDATLDEETEARLPLLFGCIKTSVRPAVESMDGSLGLSLYANPEIGVAVLESFWESRKALIHSEQMAAPRRTDVVHRAVGTVSVERYRVPVYEREAPLDTAVGLRLTRMDVDTGRIKDAVECFSATVVPRLADASGFCGALLLVDQD